MTVVPKNICSIRNLCSENVRKKNENRYGTGLYKMLSRDLQQIMPGTEGFSESNLKFAVRFYRISDLLPTDQQISDRIHQLEQELDRLRKLQQRSSD